MSLPDTETLAAPRSDWTRAEVRGLLEHPLLDLVFRAQEVHRRSFPPNRVQLSTLLNIKTGGCPEDCAYCSQSVRHDTGLDAAPLMDADAVLAAACTARAAGATRFCMGAAWRSPKDRDLPALERIIQGVRDLGLETCMTLGMLTEHQAGRLAEAGLDYYNHNLDTSPEHYERVITTRTYQDRLDTLARVRDAGIAVCSGGILGLGESVDDRAGLLHQLATLPRHPESVPINLLVQIPGTPLADAEAVEPLELVRLIAVARLLMPRSVVRLSAGRDTLGDEHQALCFLAGANSIFYGEQLLTTGNPVVERDRALFRRLGLTSGDVLPRESAAAP
jgi:biotin synthase